MVKVAPGESTAVAKTVEMSGETVNSTETWWINGEPVTINLDT
jgi:hypothetical protein